MTPSEWKAADFSTFNGGRAWFTVEVYNAFVEALNERLHVCRTNDEIYQFWSINKDLPGGANPRKEATASIISCLQDGLVSSGAATYTTLIPCVVGSLAPLINGNASFASFPSWGMMQRTIWQMRYIFVPPERFSADVPLSYATPGVTGFPSSGKTQFTRKYPREVSSLSAPGVTGQHARLILSASQFAAAAQSLRDLSGKVLEYQSGAWALAADPLADPDIIENQGLAQIGDYIGPWILDELRSALLLFKTIAVGTEFGTGTGSDGQPNFVNTGDAFYQFWRSGAIVSIHRFSRGYARHNVNRYLRSVNSGYFSEGNHSGTPGTSGDCFRINARTFTFTDNGVTRNGRDLFSTAWGLVLHSTNGRKVAALFIPNHGPYPDYPDTPGSDSWRVLTYDGLTHGYAPFDPPYPDLPFGSPPADMGKGLTDSYGGMSGGFTATSDGTFSGGVASSVLSDSKLIPFGLTANAEQLARSIAPPAGAGTTSGYNSFGSGLSEGHYASVGTKDGVAYDFDDSQMTSTASTVSKYNGSTAMQDAKIGPSSPPSPTLGIPPSGGPGETFTDVNGYAVTEILRFYSFDHEGGYQYR